MSGLIDDEYPVEEPIMGGSAFCRRRCPRVHDRGNFDWQLSKRNDLRPTMWREATSKGESKPQAIVMFEPYLGLDGPVLEFRNIM